MVRTRYFVIALAVFVALSYFVSAEDYNYFSCNNSFYFNVFSAQNPVYPSSCSAEVPGFLYYPYCYKGYVQIDGVYCENGCSSGRCNLEGDLNGDSLISSLELLILLDSNPSTNFDKSVSLINFWKEN